MASPRLCISTMADRPWPIADRRSIRLIPRNIHRLDLAAVLQIGERIAAEHDQIGPLAALERAEIARAEKFRAAFGCRRDDLHRREAGCGHQLDLFVVEI